MRLLDRLLKPTVARLVAERIEEERLDALYRYCVHGDPARLRIHPTAVVNNAIFDTGGGYITVGEYVFLGHNASAQSAVLALRQAGAAAVTVRVCGTLAGGEHRVPAGD
jgi:hypothetical protein